MLKKVYNKSQRRSKSQKVRVFLEEDNMKISDLITAEILRMLNESKENTAEIQRNEFASNFGCLISYLSTNLYALILSSNSQLTLFECPQILLDSS